MVKKIISIEPRLPPAICGTSAFSWQLSSFWNNRLSQCSHIVVDGAIVSRVYLNYEDINECGESARNLFKHLPVHEDVALLLHYASRGFSKYGTPFWLLLALQKWRKSHPDNLFLTFFHEVSPRLPLRTHHGLICAVDRYLVRRLCQMSSSIMTNSKHHSEMLTQISGINDVQWIPVTSNIRPLNNSPSCEHPLEGHFLVFGRSNTIKSTLDLFADYLKLWSANNKLVCLHCVGPVEDHLIRYYSEYHALGSGLNIIWHGDIEETEVSRLLSRASFCLSCVTPQTFSKSGTFMALAAHGCSVVTHSRSDTAPLAFTVDAEELMSLDRNIITLRAAMLQKWYNKSANIELVSTEILNKLSTAL